MTSRHAGWERERVCEEHAWNESKETRHTFPRVSGTKKNVNANASIQNAAKNIYVPQVMLSSMSGVTRPMMLWVEVGGVC